MTKPQRKSKVAGHRWRFHAVSRDGNTDLTLHSPEGGSQCVDELVIDDWFHLEQMDDNVYWLLVGNKVLDIYVNPKTRKLELRIEDYK